MFKRGSTSAFIYKVFTTTSDTYQVLNRHQFLAFPLRLCKTLWCPSQKLAKHYTPDQKNQFTCNSGLETQQDKKHLHISTFLLIVVLLLVCFLFSFLKCGVNPIMNSRASKSQGVVLASLWNAVDHSSGPDFFPIDTCDIWPSLLNWSHNTRGRNHEFKEHLTCIYQAEMKITFAQFQSFASVLSGSVKKGSKIITPPHPCFSSSRKRIRKLPSPCKLQLPISGNHPASLFTPQSTGLHVSSSRKWEVRCSKMPLWTLSP